MANSPSRTPKPKASTSASTRTTSDGDRIPTNEELLKDLWTPGEKAKAAREAPTVSRRTRDYLLLAGIGSAVILGVAFRVMSGSETMVILRLALTAVAFWCGLLGFILYGVMNRY